MEGVAMLLMLVVLVMELVSKHELSRHLRDTERMKRTLASKITPH